MYQLECRVGRLLELRFGAITTSDEHLEVAVRIVELAEQRGTRVVVAADHRRSVHFPPALLANISKGMRSVNAQVERSAILLPDTLLSEQLDRIVRATNHPSRRVFQSLETWKTWLMEVLDTAERAALERFIDE
jgi:hypothetical protein